MATGPDIDNTCPSNTKSPKRLSKAAHNTLSEIFRKIGSKENTKEVSLFFFFFKCLVIGNNFVFICLNFFKQFIYITMEWNQSSGG